MDLDLNQFRGHTWIFHNTAGALKIKTYYQTNYIVVL